MLRLAVSVVLWGATTVAAATIGILLITDDEPLDYVLFDVISAFATCGLSTGFTAGAPATARSTSSRPRCSSDASVP